MDYVFSNNYIWPGTTALLYNVHLSSYFYWDAETNTLKLYEQYANSITDIGFEWKLAGSSNWTSVSLKHTSNTYISEIVDIKDGVGRKLSNSRYDCHMYNADSEIVPVCKVLITELEPETGYVVCSYIVINNGKTRFNEISCITLEQNNTIEYEDVEFDDKASDNLRTVLPIAIEKAVDCLRLFYNNKNMHFYPKTQYDPTSNWAARASMWYNSATVNEDNVEGLRTVTIHELGHNLLHRDDNNPEYGYEAFIMKFMEFATGCPRATWRWQSLHNYPVISSARYPFILDCLVVAAFQLRSIYMDLSDEKKDALLEEFKKVKNPEMPPVVLQLGFISVGTNNVSAISVNSE